MRKPPPTANRRGPTTRPVCVRSGRRSGRRRRRGMTGRFDGDLAGTFDAIATRAADGMSRRQVAKLAIGMALSSAVPSWLLAPDLASAGKIGKEGDCPTPQAGSCPSGSLGYTKNCAHKVPNGQASFYNGCGPAAGIDLLGLAKVEPPDTPFDLAHFADACNGHDCCYGRCGADKDDCDTNFRHGMHEECSKETNALL